MDTITHGIAGALLGKAFFADDPSASEANAPARTAGRVAITAATLGALFPDSDSIRSLHWFNGNGLSVITNHRAETHSLLLLPLWALALAWLTRAVCRGRGWPSPPFARLTLIYGVAIASHIFLDLITTFGTMIFAPVNYTRYQWDLVFILDFTMTGIVLLPQVAAWVYRKRSGGVVRAAAMWLLFTLLALGVRWLAVRGGVVFTMTAAGIISAIIAALFFLPRAGGWGFGFWRTRWCRAGTAVLALHLGFCWWQHANALSKLDVLTQGLIKEGETIEQVGALPLPPTCFEWEGVVRTSKGVYVASRLQRGSTQAFKFFPDSPPNEYTARARDLPEVQAYLRFARFPVIRFFEAGPLRVVEYSDYRFFRRQAGPGGRVGFTYRVTMDEQGNVLTRGWAD